MTLEETRVKEGRGQFDCPRCGRQCGYFNIGNEQWFACEFCLVMYCVGVNLFSSWKSETWDQQVTKARGIANYTPVDCNTGEEIKAPDSIVALRESSREIPFIPREYSLEEVEEIERKKKMDTEALANWLSHHPGLDLAKDDDCRILATGLLEDFALQRFAQQIGMDAHNTEREKFKSFLFDIRRAFEGIVTTEKPTLIGMAFALGRIDAGIERIMDDLQFADFLHDNYKPLNIETEDDLSASVVEEIPH